ncbi:GNAT family N-acetyltransferase [Kitasatospora sp. RG8]|uniref:GNAT family N-acetyltransferase n=1 Tax=Kitasatospora sp. RG8 TaxID=2820815 RepID=UPI001AE06DF8|nr:GNAT family N-acetyltransferase [Kitasatospora sp. RG8]MBP0452853.1 GNAT family N-acetyltransferase [Kitasatospora sp. RG8]
MTEKESDWEFGRDIDGLPVVRFVRGEREGRPWADLLTVPTPGEIGAEIRGWVGAEIGGGVVSAADPVEFVLSSMSGWVVSGSVEFGEQLLRRGATVLRHGHTMYRDLAGDPPSTGWAAWARTPLRDGLRAVPCDRDAEEVLPACLAAYGPAHPDHRPGREQELRLLLSGRLIGPVLPAATLAVDTDDRVVAGVVLNHFEGVPWVANVFRHPGHSYPGLGRDLLRRSLAGLALAGSDRVGLAVSEGNPARRVYEALGFRLDHSSLSVIVP